MMLMRMLRESRVTLKQFAVAVRGHNAQALPLMSSAPLDFPCVLFSLYCKSDRPCSQNCLISSYGNPEDKCKHVHARARRGISFSVYMFEWRGWVGEN